MDIKLSADKENVKKDEIINYTLFIPYEENISDVTVEIIPSVEEFPDANIVPLDLEESNGIYQIEAGDLNSDIELSFSCRVEKNFEQNTTAAIVSYNNGSYNEAYTQTTIHSRSLPLAIPVICSLFLIFVSAFLIKRLI